MQPIGERLFSLTSDVGREDNECPMEVTLAVLADYANVTRDNKLLIVGIFDEINPPVLPFAMPQMYLVVSMVASLAEIESEFPTEIVLLGEDAEVARIERTITFNKPKRPGIRATHNEIIGLAGFPLERAGAYAFVVRVNREERARVALHVNSPPIQQE